MKIYLYEDITPKLVKKIQKKIDNFDPEDVISENGIWLIINSDGGDFEATLGLIDRIDYHNNLHKDSPAAINTLCYGKAYSSAAFLLTSGKQRYISKNSVVMFHSVYYSVEDMSQRDHRRMSSFYDKHCESLVDFFNKKCKDKSGNLFKKCMVNEMYLNAEQCLKLGIVDSIWNY